MFGLGLGRLTRWTFELIALSTIIAGVRRSTGFGPHTALIHDRTIRSFLDGYFNLGETVFSTVAAYVVNSPYFRKQIA
ncbi:uncharacterized protein MKK02DRAFT_40168 [Dioszegia hungarica]|uniref:Uncharacterized protein n=1 Tax=Dioszegia hungarica TaxID=4972 RepID=A0AA38LYY6_9TREE|nr:uncharacterized protein MKK02DRAFT_40168 [Dioszegia hungarica]KAI9639841.1 hypothetical protein MKK02DRAFT_40168 [Dioszegia hungarica]